jgi:hypothetical protein
MLLVTICFSYDIAGQNQKIHSFTCFMINKSIIQFFSLAQKVAFPRNDLLDMLSFAC